MAYDAIHSILGTFQSTLPQRERHEIAGIWADSKLISIHAPAKGATRGFFQSLGCFLFQSTLPQRERRSININTKIDTKFQSTLPQRERPDKADYCTQYPVFQSTLPQRERLNALLIRSGSTTFQSTLPQRERRFRDWFV